MLTTKEAEDQIRELIIESGSMSIEDIDSKINFIDKSYKNYLINRYSQCIPLEIIEHIVNMLTAMQQKHLTNAGKTFGISLIHDIFNFSIKDQDYFCQKLVEIYLKFDVNYPQIERVASSELLSSYG